MSVEGVVKYRMDFTQTAPPSPEAVRALEGWRCLLRRAGLVGQAADRYGGYAFGNLSERVAPFDAPAEARRFLITGSQTGGVERLGPDGYGLVVACLPVENRIVAEGAAWPSSEALTHGAVYAADASVRSVMHVHSPELWRRAGALGLPTTRADVPYGSPEMAREVARLFRESDVAARRLFAMGGHEDGLVAFGAAHDEAGAALLTTLAAALAPDD